MFSILPSLMKRQRGGFKAIGKFPPTPGRRPESVLGGAVGEMRLNGPKESDAIFLPTQSFRPTSCLSEKTHCSSPRFRRKRLLSLLLKRQSVVAVVRDEKRRELITIQFNGMCAERRSIPKNWHTQAIYQLETKLASTKATRESYHPRCACQAHTTRIPLTTRTCSPRRIIQIMTPVQRAACVHCESGTRVGNSRFAPRDEPLHAHLFIRDAAP